MGRIACVCCTLVAVYGCRTVHEELDLPSIEDVSSYKIRSSIDSGNPFLALQDLHTLQRERVGIPVERYETLTDAAYAEVQRQFDEALSAQEYSAAYRIRESMEVIGRSALLEGPGRGEILDSRVRYHFERGEYVLASLSLETLLKLRSFSEEEYLRYGGFAFEKGSVHALKTLSEFMVEAGYPIPEGWAPLVADAGRPSDHLKGTVTIWVNRGMRIRGGVGYLEQVIGSGFFIDPRGYVITNYHVVASEVDPEYEGYSRAYVRFSDDISQKVPARVVGYDRNFDIALLKVEREPKWYFPLYGETELEPGDTIYAIGSPGGLENTITAGIISATGRRFLQMGDVMQVDVPINHGNSGGPLVGGGGEIIGVVFAGIEQFEGVNFAIPMYWVRKILPSLFIGGETKHPWLGASVFETEAGLEITYLVPGEPLHRAGLEEGDVIVSMDGSPVDDLGVIQDRILDRGIGAMTEITWMRDGTESTGLVLLTERPYSPVEYSLARDVEDNLIPPLFGMALEPAGGVSWSPNYLVTKVFDGTIADETGLSPNDPLVVRAFEVDRENRVVLLEIRVKKRKAGFLESGVQLGAYLDTDTFI